MTKSEITRLRTILEHAPGFIVVCDLDAKILYLNRTAHGYSMEDTLGQSYYDFLTPSQAELIRAAHERVRDTGEEQTVDYFLDTPESGRVYFVTRIAAFRSDDDETISGFINIVADVTGKKVAEERLAIIEERHAREALAREVSRTEQILQTTTDGYLLLNGQGHIVDVNTTYCRMVGYSKTQLTERDILLGKTATQQLADIVLRTHQTGRAVFEATHATKDGGSIELEISASRVTFGEQTLVVAFLRDIAERKRSEAEREALQLQVQHQQKLDSIGTLASGVAHEINNPIQGIVNFAQLIERSAPEEGELRYFAQQIVREGGRVAEIVRNLMSFSRRDPEEQAPARMADIVSSCLTIVEAVLRHDQIRVVVDVPDDLPLVHCRSHQLRQVLMNLLTNARGALNDRYPRYDEHKVVEISGHIFDHDGEPWVRVVVKDYGTGIDDSVLPNVFEPFFTTKLETGGTGLGLTVSSSIVQAHGGSMDVDSRAGEYTEFRVDLPALHNESDAGSRRVSNLGVA